MLPKQTNNVAYYTEEDSNMTGNPQNDYEATMEARKKDENKVTVTRINENMSHRLIPL